MLNFKNSTRLCMVMRLNLKTKYVCFIFLLPIWDHKLTDFTSLPHLIRSVGYELGNPYLVAKPKHETSQLWHFVGQNRQVLYNLPISKSALQAFRTVILHFVRRNSSWVQTVARKCIQDVFSFFTGFISYQTSIST